MTINHRAEAEKHLSQGAFTQSPEKAHPIDPVATYFHLRMAQVHATLAAGQSGSADTAAYRHTIQTLRFALIRHVAEGLALSHGDEAHEHAKGLARYLDSVGLNVDNEVDTYVKEQTGMEPAEAQKPPSVRRAEWEAQPCPF